MRRIWLLASAADPALWYKHPAQTWGDALPVGNGRLGAMVFGRTAKEDIQLNEATIWNGKKRDRVNPEALKALPEVRRLLFAGKPREAEALEDKSMLGIPNRQPPYQPSGDLNLEFEGHENPSDYRRELNLATGIVRVTYKVGDAAFTREVFSSAPDQAIVIRITCDKPGQVSFHATLTRSQDSQTVAATPDRIILRGEAIAHTNFWVNPRQSPEAQKAVSLTSPATAERPARREDPVRRADDPGAGSRRRLAGPPRTAQGIYDHIRIGRSI